ncbi:MULTISPECIES: hypothetical protein [unclassified Meiothermus]|uniref:hypothetical protein n=1 Tax=unclassified Meiothermus TaxID=370471 RepID=UPI000D7CAEC9|nr:MULTISPECIES: hypothetical protein [unclassified Meiothermus]PZA07247.1 hypothetical protein DNA98_08535 [Meiothermus sp. Pnk-1]RYM37981.1 hypothetical protein EWH23_05200 [Meiothermus sp. PNK-Is4]
MHIRDNFTPEEWDKVLSGPAAAAAAILAAAPSGLTGIIAEGIATVNAMKELARASSAPLLQAIAASLDAKQEEQPEAHPRDGQRFKSFEEAKKAMLERLRSAFWIVQTKATPEDVSAYQQYVVSVAERVARAAKEGGFLGIGGEQVSQAEKDTLDEIRSTLGIA